jgi:osmotically-inducible protein OsmY
MSRSTNVYDRSVRSLNDSDAYEFSGESEYSRERSDPYQMVDYLLDKEVDFRGKGPKGYRIADDRIFEQVCEILARDSRIDASQVEVMVKEGCVYLSGEVDSRQTKRLAEMTIEDLPGVTDVINQLHFQRKLSSFSIGNTATEIIS